MRPRDALGQAVAASEPKLVRPPLSMLELAPMTLQAGLGDGLARPERAPYPGPPAKLVRTAILCKRAECCEVKRYLPTERSLPGHDGLPRQPTRADASTVPIRP